MDVFWEDLEVLETIVTRISVRVRLVLALFDGIEGGDLGLELLELAVDLLNLLDDLCGPAAHLVELTATGLELIPLMKEVREAVVQVLLEILLCHLASRSVVSFLHVLLVPLHLLSGGDLRGRWRRRRGWTRGAWSRACRLGRGC